MGAAKAQSSAGQCCQALYLSIQGQAEAAQAAFSWGGGVAWAGAVPSWNWPAAASRCCAVQGWHLIGSVELWERRQQLQSLLNLTQGRGRDGHWRAAYRAGWLGAWLQQGQLCRVLLAGRPANHWQRRAAPSSSLRPASAGPIRSGFEPGMTKIQRSQSGLHFTVLVPH